MFALLSVGDHRDCRFGDYSLARSNSKSETDMGDSFRDLVVWKRAFELSLVVYRLTSEFPAREQFGLTNQLRRASVSVASNIAEGYGRSTRGEYVQFLGHARGSICEVQTQLAISEALKYGSAASHRAAGTLGAEVSWMLNALMRKLQSK